MEPTQSEAKEDIKKYSVLEIIGAIIGTSGLFGALGWYFGRNYYNGYYGAIGVSTRLIDLSNNDLISQGQTALLTFMLVSASSLFFLILISTAITQSLTESIEGISNRYLKRVNEKLKKTVLYYIAILMPLILLSRVSLSSYNFYELIIMMIVIGILTFDMITAWGEHVMKNPKVDNLMASIKDPLSWWRTSIIAFFRVMLFAIFVSVIFFNSATQMYYNGYKQGCIWVFSKPASITIYSKNPILLENGSQIPEQKGLFQYTGYFGFVAKEYLILYKKVDDKNRRPETVYFVPKGEIISFDITQVTSSKSELQVINDLCETDY